MTSHSTDDVVAVKARPRSTMFTRRVHALVFGAVLLLFALLLVIPLAHDPIKPFFQSIDDRWLHWIEGHRTAWVTRTAKILSKIGSPVVTLPLRIVVIVSLALYRRWLQLGAFLGAMITSELCIGPLKSIVDRPRPPDGLVATSGSSFPSGHAIAGAVTAFGLVVILVPATARRLTWIGVAAAFAGLMALSRTYLAAHWLTDVIAGACIGTGFALVWPAGLELLRDRWQGRHADRTAQRAQRTVQDST
jgi:undecaprenyl-diphosphatase